MGKKNHIWEKSSQVKEIMETNKPVWIKDNRKQSMWETCIQEYFEKDKRKWERRKNVYPP